MEAHTERSAFRNPSALIPLLMSVAALAVVAIQVLVFGTARQADEGPSAHLFQLLMVGQVPAIAYFAFASRKRPSAAMLVIGTQLLAAAVAMAPVALLGL
jgi:hypothetical protein